MKIFRSVQIRELDSYTIEHEPIASIDLMERASARLFEWLSTRYGKQRPFFIFAGPGNNGGDGLALARMLVRAGYKADVRVAGKADKFPPDMKTNLDRLSGLAGINLHLLNPGDTPPAIPPDALVVDALFGSGLDRPLEGWYAGLVKHINASGNEAVSIDIPSGLFGEDNSGNNPDSIIRATHTLAFQFPRLSFFFAGNAEFTGEWHVLPIGLHPGKMESMETPFRLLTGEMLSGILKNRKKFSHKGNYGHALLVAGCYGRMGAAVLGAKACLRAGAGLLTVHVPRCGGDIIQTSVPEAMLSIDESDILFSGIPDTAAYTAIGIGPAIGCRKNSHEGLKHLVENFRGPLVMDADAINILGMHPEWLGLLPEGTVLTPHPKEFERMTGRVSEGYSRLMLQIEISVRHKLYIVLKGAYTSVTCPDGTCFFNTTGNPGMATAGSGDVLTGIILSFLAQDYHPREAALLGVYIHGLAGDAGSQARSPEALIAGDITEYLGNAFNTLRHDTPAKN